VVNRARHDHDLAVRTALETELHRAQASRILARWTGASRAPRGAGSRPGGGREERRRKPPTR